MTIPVEIWMIPCRTTLYNELPLSRSHSTGTTVPCFPAKIEGDVLVLDHVPSGCRNSVTIAINKKNRVTYWICLRIVSVNKIQKYKTRIGQYTGTSNASKIVHTVAIKIARVEDSQKFHSGRRRTKGLNSSSFCEGRLGMASIPSSISSAWRSASSDGSNFGWRKARSRFRRYIPSASKRNSEYEVL